MNRRMLLIGALVSGVLVTVVTAIGAAAVDRSPRSHQPVTVIEALGQEDFEPNALIFSTFRFDPGRSFPHSGDTVRLVDHDRSEAAPHTLTVVRQGQLPTTFDEVLFGCEACEGALGAHFATDPPTRRVGLQDGLNAPGDSMLISNGQTVGATLTAPSGSVLYFLCAFHPWMQGRLVVG